jgi:hypothetical protein
MITFATAALFAALAADGLMTAPRVPAQHFTIGARYEAPAKKGAAGAVVVQFDRKDPDVSINEDPAPRIRFADDAPLIAPAPPRGSGTIPDPADVKYLDISKPVRFEVKRAPGAVAGTITVRASVSYFYCSKRENWCRKGTAEFDLPVDLR